MPYEIRKLPTLFPQGNLYFGEPDAKVVETRIISLGVHADFNRNSKLIGIETNRCPKNNAAGRGWLRLRLEFQLTTSNLEHRTLNIE